MQKPDDWRECRLEKGKEVLIAGELGTEEGGQNLAEERGRPMWTVVKMLTLLSKAVKKES